MQILMQSAVMHHADSAVALLTPDTVFGQAKQTNLAFLLVVKLNTTMDMRLVPL